MATITITVVECDAPTCPRTKAEDDLIHEMNAGVSEWWHGKVWQQNEEAINWVACSRAHIKAAVLEAYALSEDED